MDLNEEASLNPESRRVEWLRSECEEIKSSRENTYSSKCDYQEVSIFGI